MNGSLVIPKLICIKFYRLFFNHAITGDIKKPAVFTYDGPEAGSRSA